MTTFEPGDPLVEAARYAARFDLGRDGQWDERSWVCVNHDSDGMWSVTTVHWSTGADPSTTRRHANQRIALDEGFSRLRRVRSKDGGG